MAEDMHHAAKRKSHIPRDREIAQCGMLLSVLIAVENPVPCTQCEVNSRMVWDGHRYVAGVER